MNIENLISRYLAIHKSVSFEEIGTLSTMSYAETPADNEHTNTDNIFQFEFNLKAKADQGLITYAVEQTGKLRSLIASDIQSFTFTGKQFLNIGKPFLIKDIGYFQKNNDNEYLFFKGNPIAEAPKMWEPIFVAGHEIVARSPKLMGKDAIVHGRANLE